MEQVSDTAILALLNSAPVVRGVVQDALVDPGDASGVLAAYGAPDDESSRASMRAVRDALHRVGHGTDDPRELERFLAGVERRPAMRGDTLEWRVDGPARVLPAARAVIDWFAVQDALPGRLRPCANPECTKFLVDRSRPNTAKWCSMAECGNRLKARRHVARQQG